MYVWRCRHVPIESDEADPARAMGTFPPLHAPTGTMRFPKGMSLERNRRVRCRRCLIGSCASPRTGYKEGCHERKRHTIAQIAWIDEAVSPLRRRQRPLVWHPSGMRDMRTRIPLARCRRRGVLAGICATASVKPSASGIHPCIQEANVTIIAVDVRNRKSVVLARSLPNDVAVDLQRAMKSSGRWENVEIVD